MMRQHGSRDPIPLAGERLLQYERCRMFVNATLRPLAHVWRACALLLLKGRLTHKRALERCARLAQTRLGRLLCALLLALLRDQCDLVQAGDFLEPIDDPYTFLAARAPDHDDGARTVLGLRGWWQRCLG